AQENGRLHARQSLLQVAPVRSPIAPALPDAAQQGRLQIVEVLQLFLEQTSRMKTHPTLAKLLHMLAFANEPLAHQLAQISCRFNHKLSAGKGALRNDL